MDQSFWRGFAGETLSLSNRSESKEGDKRERPRKMIVRHRSVVAEAPGESRFVIRLRRSNGNDAG